MQSKFLKIMLCIVLSNNIVAAVPSITISYPANGSTITNHQPVVSGTVFPNIGVDLKIDGITSPEGTRTVPNQWHIKSSTVLANGTHTAVATVTTVGGKTAQAKSTFTVTSAPSKKLTITSPSNGSIITAPVVITGTAKPGSKLAIQIINVKSGKTILGKLTVNVTGSWSFTPTGLTLGKNVIRVTATSSSGVISTASSTFTLVAPVRPSSSCNPCSNPCKPCCR